MASDIDPIVVQIQAEFGDLKRDLAEVKTQMKGVGDTAASETRNVEKLGKALKVVGVAALAAATAAGALALKQIEASNQTELWARRLNIASTAFSRLEAVGKRFGASTDDVGDAIKDLNERIADAARGNKTYEEALNLAGLASSKLINLPVEEQFLKVADAIGKMSNAGDRNLVTAELMADAGFRLIPMFQQGEKAIREMANEVIRTNAALTEFEFEQLNKVTEANRKLAESIEALGNALAIHLAPGLQLAAEWAGKLTDSAKEMLGVSETAMKDRLVEINAEMAKLEANQKRTGRNRRKIPLSENHAYIALLQERVKLENALSSKEKNISGEPSSGKGKGDDDPVSGNGLGAALRQAQIDAILSQEFENAILLGEVQKEQRAKEMEAAQEHADAMLNMDFENALIAGEQKEAARVAEEEAHKAWLDRMFGADKRAADENLKLYEAGWKGKAMLASKFMGSMSQLMNTNSRKQFEIGKAAAISQVAIDTPKAAMSAYSAMAGIPIVGPALGVAASFAAISSGVAQMQSIKSQSFGGGGGVAGGGIAGADGGAGAQQAQSAPENVIDASFNIQGQSVSSESVRGMLGSLNELIEDGGNLRSVTVI